MEHMKKKGENIMDGMTFILRCMVLVWEREQDRVDRRLSAGGEMDVLVINVTKTLQNNKGFFSSTLDGSPMYEINYDGDNEMFYIDTYEKTNNEAVGKELTKKVGE